MDVPFISSGALSSAHYAIVRHVELAKTAQDVDHFLLTEVASVRAKLSRARLSSKQCRECLIILMYCFLTSISGIPPGDLAFALPHAVNLAEAGSSVKERRIGYLFCSSIMPSHDEFKLMLVNTLRKDLESPDVARISLALEYIVQSPTEEIIPAIQSRLLDLLSHNSPHVRRRALFASRALAAQDSSLLRWTSQEISKRLRDPDSMVVNAAIATCIDLSENRVLGKDAAADIQKALLHLIEAAVDEPAARRVTQKILRLYGTLTPPSEVITAVLALIKRISTHRNLYALLLDAFAVIRQAPYSALKPSAKSTPIVATIRHLLPSHDPNEQYLFLTCLEYVDPRLWAGTSPTVPAVLEGWEVERIMQFLSSPDAAIRTKTLRILARVDPSIVSTYLSQKLQDLAADDDVLPLLEAAEVLATDDGEQYARSVKDVFAALSDEPGARHISEAAIERVLTYIRDKDGDFGPNVATALLASFLDAGTDNAASENTGFAPSATLMVVVTTLAVEYVGRAAVAPAHLLHALSVKLRLYPVSIQELSLIAMLRLAGELDSVPEHVSAGVRALNEVAGRHIQRRCLQFMDITSKPEVLQGIISNAPSRSLPDFLVSLETHQQTQPQSPRISHHASPPTSPSLSRLSLSGSKLRYTAYDAPPPVPAARMRRSSSRQSTSSVDGRPGSSLSSSRREDEYAYMSRTVTAGDLAVAAGSPELKSMALGLTANRSPISSPKRPGSIDLLGSKVDLISLDSPFIAEPPTALEELEELNHDFESSWNALQKYISRGWCEVPIDAVVRKLQSLPYSIAVLPADQTPFEGELKVLLSGRTAELGRGRAALRLREGSDDEDGCLWRLRCDDDEILNRVKRALAE
ncbi:ARM repeat-containing protein [Auriscalpium vulgare]|uniref:ARM repeat-containing protein n=1 Tax=Auriscalpium vulgare TaxID=40419 RepID=A0ACB8R8C3_9AGAM|nr:ARM repeat-containing protein [Auriscalpium vulgare]